MPTFRPHKAQSIAQRMAELMNAPAVADMAPDRRFLMPRADGPGVSSSIATEMQRLMGTQPDGLVSDQQQYDKAQIARPDLFSASLAAVKSLSARRKAIADAEGRVRAAPRRFEADVARAVHLQEREG